MKRKFTFLITAALMLLTMMATTGTMWGQTRGSISWTASGQGYTNQEVITSVTFDASVSGTFYKGTNNNAPKYYTSGTAIRCYGGNYFTISTSTGNLTSISISFGSSDGSNAITTDVGNYSDGSWNGEATSVTFTIGGTSGNRRIAGFEITYTTGGGGSDPTITLSDSGTGNIGNYAVNTEITRDFTVTQSNLTDDISLNATNGGTFTIGDEVVTSIPASDEPLSTVVRWHFTTPEEAGQFTSKITATSGETSATCTYMGYAFTSHNVNITQGIEHGTVEADPTSGIQGTYITLTVTPDQGYELEELTVLDGNNNEIEVNDLNRFQMPDSDVTVSATFTTATVYEWVETDLAALTESDIFVIVGNNGSNYAMTNDNGTGSAPAASAVTVTAGKITSAIADNIKWNISGNADDGYTFYPNGTTSTWLYCTSTNNGVRVGTNANKTFKIDHDYLQNQGTSRYVGIYNSSDWRCYTSYTTDNIKNQSFAFYKRIVPASVATPVFSVAAGTYNANQSVTITCATGGATIYYTTDGSEPTNLSSEYTEPVSITQTTTLKAIAIKNAESSNVASATYTLKCATPAFSVAGGSYTSVQSVTITCATDGASIYYTTDGTTPTNASTLYEGPVSISETKTLKAIAIKSNWSDSDVASATYTIELPLNTMQAIFDRATAVGSTPTSVNIAFNNWVITGVNNSKHAFLSDGEKGCMIYVDNHGGFSEGNILSGTANCNVQLFNASAELTNINTTTEGLTVTPGSSPTPRVTTIDALGAINSGSLVTLKDLTYNGSALSDGVNTITPYNTIYSATLTNGKTYDVTGVFVLNNTTKRINPRREADIVLKADMSATVFSGLTAFTYLVDNGPSAAQHIELYGEDFADDLTVTASGDYEVSTDNTTYLESVVVAHDEGDIAEDLYVRLKSGLATGDHNGTLTFTATNLTTVEQALEGTVTASATYDIMIDSSIAHGTVTTSASVAEAGDTITLTVTPDECYQFVEWVTEPDSLTWTSANQFTMPAEDVLISATFSQIVYTIQYSVNGVVESGLQEYVNCGSTASLWNEDELEIAGVELPTECSLLGWSSASGNTEILSSLEPEANATLYAVLAYGDTSYDLVTSVSELSVGDIIVIASNIYNYAMSTTQNTNNRGQAEITKTDNHITITTSVCEFVLGEGNVDNTWSFYDGTQSGYIYAASSSSNHLKTEASLSNNSSWEISISEGIASVTAQGSNTHNVLQHNNGSSLFSCYSSASQTAISLYKKHSSAYTNVLVENLTGDITLTEPTYIPAGTIVDAGNHTITTSAANLIIEDGGQLIHESDVQATVQKSVAAYTAKDGDGWYLIASPVDNYSTSTIATGTYDLFIYNEPNAYWYSNTGTAAPFDTLTRGKGYLYANAANVNLNYAGTMKATNANIKVDLSYACDEYPDLKGFNLVGNPFTRNLTATDMVFGGTNVVSYYDFNADRTEFVTYQINERPIQPGQGFFIQATASEQKLVFNPTTPPTKDASDFKYISISAGDENFTDKAYIQFGYGNTLRKMTFGENTMVYVMNNDDDYAAARVDELAGTMPVHFVPIEDGFYTITVETKNIENLNYMHLIDNIKNTEIDLLVEPNYTFKASESDNADRFYLVFDFNNYTGVNENYTNDNFAHQIGDEIFVSGEGTLQVFDVLGRFVTGYNVNGDKRISTAEFNTGVYIFRMVGTEVKTQKIIVR